MPKFYDSISEELGAWAMRQSVFFTASAPLAGKHINLSPKGLPAASFAILSPKRAAYVDATGSGAETIAHVYENGRITIMFCSFDANPRILRFFCTGRVVEWDQPEFAGLLKRMGKSSNPLDGGARAVIVLDVFKVQTSCGYGVPRLAAKQQTEPSERSDGENWLAGFEDRATLGHFAATQVERSQLRSYQQEWNSDSLDGLTALKAARRGRGEVLWATDLKAWLVRILAQREALAVGFCAASLLYVSHVWWWNLSCRQ